MKIYPSKHKIKAIPTSKVDTSLNVPLAYVDIDFTKNKISKIVDANFATNRKTILYPGQSFVDKNFKVFNKNEEEIKNIDNLFLYNNDSYTFYPNNTIKFTPKKFLWKATVKRKFDYSIANTYDLKIGCKYNATLKDNLVKTFMNPSDRDLLVHDNIRFNHNDTMYDTFVSSDDAELDFLYIKSHNCVHYDVDGQVAINFETLLQNHTNLWIGCEDAVALHDTYNMLVATTPTTFAIKNPIITKECSIASKYYFDLSKMTVPPGVSIHNIFDSVAVPALILEYQNMGFVVITSYTILDDMLEYEKFMYEVMMYVYLNTYNSTDYVPDWITYEVPDYELHNGIYSVKSGFVSKKSIITLLDLNGDYELVRMDCVNDDAVRTLMTYNEDGMYDTVDDLIGIVCVGQNGGHPIFAIESTLVGYIEPDKPAGWKSIFCNGEIYYLEKLYYLIEEDITNKIMMIEKDNNLIVTLNNFKSSSFNINKQIDTSIIIPFIKTDGELIQRIREAEYVVYYNKNTDAMDFCFMEDYIDGDDRYKLFNIIVEQSEDAIEVYDMRQLGGGLSEDEEDNFELLDIGHINGRPYRIAGSLVLTMPSKYSTHDEYIQKALDKYKVAEDYIAVFYKDEEDD